ncbi:MAG: hypothetical protein ACK4IY_03380 [Chitinophagales bacterium]
MKKYNCIMLAIIAVLLVACSGNKNAEHMDAHATEAAGAHSMDGSVLLDNGKRWQANAETTQGIENMLALTTGFSETENIEAYHVLKGNLENAFQNILQQCTMTGAAHDQLHNYLMPMKAMFTGLQSDNLDSCKHYLKVTDTYLKGYDDFFE